jgi:hypothetical protein
MATVTLAWWLAHCAAHRGTPIATFAAEESTNLDTDDNVNPGLCSMTLSRLVEEVLALATNEC